MNTTGPLWSEKRGHEELPDSLCFGPQVQSTPSPSASTKRGPAHLHGAGKWKWGIPGRDIQQVVKALLLSKSRFNYCAISLPFFITKLSEKCCLLAYCISRIFFWRPCQWGSQPLRYPENFVRPAVTSALNAVLIPQSSSSVMPQQLCHHCLSLSLFCKLSSRDQG